MLFVVSVATSLAAISIASNSHNQTVSEPIQEPPFEIVCPSEQCVVSLLELNILFERPFIELFVELFIR